MQMRQFKVGSRERFGAAGEASPAGPPIKRSVRLTTRTSQINSLMQNVSFTPALEDYFCRWGKSLTISSGSTYGCAMKKAPALICKPGRLGSSDTR